MEKRKGQTDPPSMAIKRVMFMSGQFDCVLHVIMDVSLFFLGSTVGLLQFKA